MTAIDIAPDMIERGQVDAGHRRRRTSTGTSATPPRSRSPDDSYDVVLCQMGLMFMEDRPAALAEMRRVLVPGGRVVVNTPGAIQPPFELMEQAIVDHISPELGGFVRAVFSMHDPDAVATLLRDAGLRRRLRERVGRDARPSGPGDVPVAIHQPDPDGAVRRPGTRAAQAAMERQVVDTWGPFVVDGKTLVDQPMVIAAGRK